MKKNSSITIKEKNRATPKAKSVKNWTLTENLVNNIWDAWIVTDTKFKVLTWNKAAEKMYGWKEREILNRSLNKFLKTQFPAGIDSETVFQKVLQSGHWQGEVNQNQKDGSLFPVLTSISLVKDDAGNPGGFIIINRNITETKMAEEALLQFRKVMDESNDAIFFVDTEKGNYFDFNQTACKMLGYSREELSQLGPMDIAQHITSMQVWRNRVEIVREQNGLIFETTYRRKDQTTFPVEISSRIMNISGKDIIVAIARDITQRKQTEEALQKSESMYRLLAENSSDGVSLLDAGNKVIYTSPAFGKMLGYTDKDILNIGPAEIMLFIHPDDRDRIKQEIIRGQELKLLSSQYEYRAKAKNGTYIWLEDVLRREFDENGKLIRSIANARDITRRKQIEEELRQQSSQLASLRQIDLELAAELNLEKLLASITNHACELLKSNGGGIYLYRADIEKLELAIAVGKNNTSKGKFLERGEGLSGKIWQIKQPLIVEDYENWPGRASIYEGIPFKAVIGVPIQWGGEFLGVLNLLADAPQKFNQQDIALLELFAGHSAVAIHNARLYQNVQNRVKQLEALHGTSKSLSGEFNLNVLLQSIVDNARKLLNSSTSSMYLTLPSGDALELIMVTEPDYPTGAYLRFGEGVAGRVAQTRQPIRIDDYSNWEGRANIYRRIPIHAVLEVPMLYRGELIGVLTADESGESKRKFTEDDERLLSLFASQAAGAIHSARLYSEIRHRAQEFIGLYETTRDLSMQLDLSTVLNKITERATELLGVPNASINLYDADQDNLELVARIGLDLPLSTRRQLGNGLAGRVAQSREPLVVENYQNWEGRSNLFNSIPYSTVMGVPLLYGGKLMGVLDVAEIEPSTRKFNEEDLRLLSLFAGQAASAIDNAKLFDSLQRSNTDLTLAYYATIEGWSRAMDLRDKETEGHTLRVAELAIRLARAMNFDESEIVHIRRGGLLHDIGKLGVPDKILLKDENLTPEEWDIMRRHPVYAYEMLSQIDYLKPALTIPYCHHEKWDGTGYPNGLKGEDIPLPARIFAFADVWDALRSDRPYRQGWSTEKAIEYIKSQAGIHFDPSIAETFLDLVTKTI